MRKASSSTSSGKPAKPTNATKPAKSSKSTKASKPASAPKSPKSTKPSKSRKATESSKSPEAVKSSKATNSSKATKAPKSPKATSSTSSTTYYLAHKKYLGKRVMGEKTLAYYLYKDGEWVKDTGSVISDLLYGYDSSEPAGSPYGFGNLDIMRNIESISAEERAAACFDACFRRYRRACG